MSLGSSRLEFAYHKYVDNAVHKYTYAYVIIVILYTKITMCIYIYTYIYAYVIIVILYTKITMCIYIYIYIRIYIHTI